jgi:hypothetical protein
VKNGGFYIESFIRHHLAMGVRHIFLLDNGSSDRTLEIARAFSCVSGFRTDLPVGKYQKVLKRVFAATVGGTSWCLDLDIDELFDYPARTSVSLTSLISYLNQHRFTAVVTQMLDMFPERPLSDLDSTVEADLKGVYRQYNLQAIRRETYLGSKLGKEYGARNRFMPEAETPDLFFGGIRKQFYGLDCLLTKHALFRQAGGLDVFPHVHFVDNAFIADVTGVLLHYKFTANAAQLATQNAKAFDANSSGYNDFLSALSADPELSCLRAGAQELASVDQLVADGFLAVGPQYQRFVHSDA